MLSLRRKRTNFFNYIIVNRLHLQKVMRLNWLYVVLCFFVVQPSYAAATPLTGISKITAGASHACALTTGGGVKCWGDNGFGQLGNSTSVESDTTVNVTGLTSGVTAITAGEYHTCALTTNGAVKCWGYNDVGQLGNNSTTRSNSSVPVDVVGLSKGVKAIYAGSYHTCALPDSGGVKCWGAFKYSNSSNPTPVDVTGLDGSVTALSGGLGQTCALTTNGNVECWGNRVGLERDANGFVVSTKDAIALVPEYVTAGYHVTAGGFFSEEKITKIEGNLSDIIAISAASQYNCALTKNGGVKCWGRNNQYQLGDGTNTDRTLPADVKGLTSGIKAISGTCALTDSGGVKCWGYAYANSTPQDIAGLNNVTAISVRERTACALVTGGGVKCGWDVSGEPTVTDVLDTKPTTYTFSTAKTGNGDITASTIAGSYDSGTKITLTAVPATGSTFAGWTPSTCVNGFALTANTICTATFSTKTACVTAQNLGVTKTENSAVSLEIPSISLCGGIQVKAGTRQNKVTQNLNDDVDVRATINIDSDSYVGQVADLVVHAIYKPLNSTASLNFMLNESGAPILWEKTLVPFKSNVTLSKTQEVVMYKGKFVGTGQLLVYLGFRLKKDGIVISNSTPIDILINP
ncbi:MAG: hypothetical protein RL368_1841 [Pseudomonadota bacterium]|jgi:hypothetical protein